MNNLFINSSRLEIVDAIGLGIIIGELEFIDENDDIHFLTLCEVDSFPEVYLTNESIFDTLADNNIDDETLSNLEKYQFVNIESYKDIYSNQDSDYYKLLKILAYIIRCDMDDLEAFQSIIKDKNADEVIVPLCDEEQEYIDSI